MRRTDQRAARFERQFVEFDVFFQVQRRQGAYAALVVVAKQRSPVIVPDHVDFGPRRRRIDEIAQLHPKRLSDAESHP